MRPWFLVLLALVTLPGCSTIQIGESDVFLPKPSVTPATFDRPGVTLTEHRVPVEDTVAVDLWHLTQPDAEATVLFFGGNGFYLVQSLGYIDALTRLPVNVVLWDYRGYGTSDGSPSVPAFKRDALNVYAYATDTLGADPKRLVVHGHSLGTFLASYTAQQRTVGGVVLENPATDVDGWVDSVIPWYIRLFVNVEVAETLRGESNIDRIRDLDVPIVIAGGADDNVTSPDMARALHEAAPHSELVIVDGTGHNGVYDAEAYQAAYRALLERMLQGAEVQAGR